MLGHDADAAMTLDIYGNPLECHQMGEKLQVACWERGSKVTAVTLRTRR
jgi:hypothetical protein